MTHARLALLLLVLALWGGAAAGPAHAEDNPLEPSPHASADEAMRHTRNRTADASQPEPADVVGAITLLPGDRLGFMPLLQHHMAVEHWFLEGVSPADISEALGGSKRCFVRLRGSLTLLGIFGGSGLEWYGTGLRHGRAWGPVMGYHERVYEFQVDEVVWARDRTTHLELRAKEQAASKRVRALLGALKYTEATEAIREAIEGHRDTGLDVRGLTSLEQHASMMVVLLSNPATWSEADTDVVVGALVGKPSRPFRELRKGAVERLRTLIASWPDAVHERLAPRVVRGWMDVEYRHVRTGLRPVVSALRSEVIEVWTAQVSEAEAGVAAAKAELEALRDTGEYAAMLRVLEAAQAHQAIVLDYALAEGQTKHWVPAARRLAALAEVWDDPTARIDLLLAQVKEAIASRSGLPNSNVKPRYNEEIRARFAPKSSAAERKRVESLLLEIARPLTPKDHWQEILLAGELLSIFGGEEARAFFPSLLARSRRSPKWQRDHLARFAKALGVED